MTPAVTPCRLQMGWKKGPIWKSQSDFAFRTKNRDPFPALEQVMASIYLILLWLPWRNAITQNGGATGADIDGLCR